jgi:hypothetical protein
MPLLEDCNDVEYLVDGEALVIMRSRNIQIKDDDVKQYMDNIFHTRCHLNNKVCNMIINNESCANVSSATIVKKLSLNIIKYERPYKL